jgi:hypothetical protein
MKRGRPSAASLEVIHHSPIDAVARQSAPHELTDEQCEVWAAVVNTEPADWFSPSNVHLLAQYCRHAVSARHIAELIERAIGDPDLKARDYSKLLEMQARESACMCSLSQKLRISPHSQTNHRGNKKAKASKPWEA